MKIKLLSCLLFLFLSVHFVGAQTTKEQSSSKEIPSVSLAKITIDGMACQEGCADTIQLNLSKIKGVHKATVSFETGMAMVEFDPKMVSEEEIQKTITDTRVKDYVYSIKDIVILENPM
ncbi:heavy-metal-associated domain-containing protein [Flagellimonas nanhaiensis]|uniref:Heavy-metal-associated domain-containing protein n=1 Tax=Flagellimonas nanhaiensis TaxID=2292706 RepID=A0A371JQ15_9FLAO|nr:heavy metal-associated domain-containing protein [Allomuricauda nanhaiensis]RDY59556.1 heavy-metal-associated domain-containing protein [Allomuricauda nanhaiensis]